MRRLVSNPPWVGRALEHLSGNLRGIPREWYPILASDKPGAWEAVEYGCGAYGCVVPTHDPSVVLKLTTDDTEAEFASDYSASFPTSCVRYHRILKTNVRHENNMPLFLLWRDAAEHVGGIRQVLGLEASVYVRGQHRAGVAAYKAARTASDKAMIRRLAREWAARCQAMAVQTEVPEIRALGVGLLQGWTELGVMFGDIHEGNLGLVNGAWVITDPGHIAVIDRAGEPAIAAPGGVPDSVENTLFEAQPTGDRQFWVQWNDMSWRLVSSKQAWQYFADALPAGFKPEGGEIQDSHEYALLRGVPSGDASIRHNTLYVIYPRELAERRLFGGTPKNGAVDRVLHGWGWTTNKEPTLVGPIVANIDSAGSIFVTDGVVRLYAAAATDREVAVRFFPGGKEGGMSEIADVIRSTLPGTIATQ